MEYNLNKGIVLDMAATMRKAVPGMKNSASLELISKMFKQPNWDTFCGLLTQADNAELSQETIWANRFGWQKNAPILAKPVKVYFDATSDTQNPVWACVDFSQELLNKIVELQTRVLRGNLTEVSYEWPVDFDVEAQSSNYYCADLFVSQDMLTFKALMRKYAESVETRWVDISTIFAAVSNPGSKSSSHLWIEDMVFISGACPIELVKALVDDEVLDISEEVIDAL